MFLFFARVPRGCDVALRATWQRHAGSRGAYAVCIFILLHNLYSKGFQPSVYRKGIHLTNPSGLINPTGFTNIFRVGLSPTQFLNMQVTW